MKYLKVILMLGLVFAYPNLRMLKNESKQVGDYAIVFVEDEYAWPGTNKHLVRIFEYKYKCVGVFVTPQDGGGGCWELVGLPDQTLQRLLQGDFK